MFFSKLFIRCNIIVKKTRTMRRIYGTFIQTIYTVNIFQSQCATPSLEKPLTPRPMGLFLTAKNTVKDTLYCTTIYNNILYFWKSIFWKIFFITKQKGQNAKPASVHSLGHQNVIESLMQEDIWLGFYYFYLNSS